MRKLALMAALASTAIATPALALDNSWYAGVEGGAMIVSDQSFDADTGPMMYPDAVEVAYNTGIDLDLIAGYDFGVVRTELELGYKRAGVDLIRADDAYTGLSALQFDASGNGRALSAMVNGLLDFGDDNGWNGYIGGGVGLADVKLRADVPTLGGTISDSDTAFAYQFIAGVRKAITSQVDLGLKYRYFRTGRMDFEDGGDRLTGKWESNSLLASLIFNFAPPPPPPVVCPDGTELPAGSTCPVPPPPPPPPPQTQTCPDGSVILATEECPPPPPPPPPPPEPERG